MHQRLNGWFLGLIVCVTVAWVGPRLVWAQENAPSEIEPTPATEAAPADKPAPVEEPATNRFAELGEATKQSFAPVDGTELEAARSRLATSASRLESMLSRTPSTSQGWLDYLAWDGIQGQLTDGAKFDPAACRTTLQRINSGAEGLSRTQVREAAAALEDYMTVASFAAVSDQTSVFGRQVDLLAGLLDADDLGDPRDSYEIERRLALLSGLDRGSELLSAARDENSRPNLMVDVGSPLIGRIATRWVDECDAINDCILGTAVRGTGRTQGDVSVQPLDAAGRARLHFTFTGTTYSRTRGVNGPVAIYSKGTTPFYATQIVDFSDNAFYVWPAEVDARTKSKTLSVKKIDDGFGKRIIEKIAKKKVAEKKSQADAIASGKAERRIAEGFGDEVRDKIADARASYDEDFHQALAERGGAPRRVDFSSTQDGVSIVITQASESQLAAPGPAPQAIDGGDASARVHQTFVNNTLAPILGGVSIRRDAHDADPVWEGAVKPSFLEDRESDPVDEEGFKPWKIRFREGRPVSCVFDEGLVTATIHAARIEVEGDTYDGWDLTLVLKPEVVDGEWKLIRQGDIDVIPTAFDPDSGRGLPSRTLALRSNLVKAINDPPDRVVSEIAIDEIDLTDRDLAIDRLRVHGVSVDEGWLGIAWQAE